MMRNISHVHIIGIGGAGLNGIAHILIDQGKKVTGGEKLSNKATDALKDRGVIITDDANTDFLNTANLVLVSSALKNDHPAILAARKKGIRVIKRHNLWEEWSKEREVIAIAGSHGKTTTAAMIAHIFESNDVPCGYLVGVHGRRSGKWGEGGPLIIEADEYDKTFLSLTPSIALITSIGRDHVDIYRSDAEYFSAFKKFAEKTIVHGGNLFVVDSINTKELLAGLRLTTYGLNISSSFYADSFQRTKTTTEFYIHYNEKSQLISLPIIGRHNIYNSIAAISASYMYGVSLELSAKALSSFPSLYRRMEFKGFFREIPIYDDYAHHWQEVESAIECMKEHYPKNRLVVYFQPHTYSRLEAFFSEYINVLSIADLAVIGDVYGARELHGVVVSKDLNASLPNSYTDTAKSPEDACKILQEVLVTGDVLVILSAGDGTKVIDSLVSST